jgi:hypothetical protein
MLYQGNILISVLLIIRHQNYVYSLYSHSPWIFNFEWCCMSEWDVDSRSNPSFCNTKSLKRRRIQLLSDFEITSKVCTANSSASASGEIGIADVELVSICFCLPNGRDTAEAGTNYVIRFVEGWLRFGGFGLSTEVMLNLSLLGMLA